MNRVYENILAHEWMAHLNISDSSDTEWKFPVFIYETELMKSLVRPFPDMVVAVHAQHGEPIRTLSFCGKKRMTRDPTDIRRGVLSAILRSLYGVAPTGYAQNERDFLWSIAETPFGDFSSSFQINFSQKDSARRNALLSILTERLERVSSLYEKVAQHALPLNKFATDPQRLDTVWVSFLKLLEQSTQSIELNNYRRAKNAIYMMDDLLNELDLVVASALARRQHRYVCPSTSYALSILVSMGTFLLWTLFYWKHVH